MLWPEFWHRSLISPPELVRNKGRMPHAFPRMPPAKRGGAGWKQRALAAYASENRGGHEMCMDFTGP